MNCKVRIVTKKHIMKSCSATKTRTKPIARTVPLLGASRQSASSITVKVVRDHRLSATSQAVTKAAGDSAAFGKPVDWIGVKALGKAAANSFNWSEGDIVPCAGQLRCARLLLTKANAGTCTVQPTGTDGGERQEDVNIIIGNAFFGWQVDAGLQAWPLRLPRLGR